MIESDEDRYRLLIEAITDYAIYMLDPSGRVVSWNPGAQRFKGYAAEEVIGEHFSRFYTDADKGLAAPARALATAAEEGRFEAEGWRVRRDGSRFWAHVIIDPIRDPAGVLVGYAKITRDLTERKAAEEALRRSQEQFRVLVEGVTDYAIYMLDPLGAVVSWNAGAQRIKGYAAEEIVGQHFSRFYTREDREADLPSSALRIAAEEGRFEKESWRLRKDGSRFWAHVVIDAIRDEAGAIIGFAKVTRDITERMEGQRALEQAREALFQAQKLEAIGQLTGGVAHDFNNLLMAVLGSLELVQKRIGHDPRVTPLVENAIAGAQRGAALTQRMLAFARRQDLRLKAVDIPVLTRGLVDFVQRSIGPQIDIRLDFPASLPPVRSDPNQLESALLNLIVNARDAMPDGGEIVIAAEAALHDGTVGDFPHGDYVRLRVADDGPGMDADTLARAAEPFFTTKGVGKGTGLGLSMVHGIVAQSGGGLQIASAPGQGTQVDLWLPQASEPARVSPETAVTLHPAARRAVVLAVDDDPLVLTNTVAMLQDIGHGVIAAASGGEALRLLGERADVGLVLTDEMMPGTTGSELAVRAREQRPGLRVVITSGYADLDPAPDRPAQECRRLSKPFTLGQLASALEAELDVPDTVDAGV